MLQVGFPGVDRPAVGLSVIPSLRGGGMECCDRCGRSGSIRGSDSPGGGGHDGHDPRPTAVVGDHALRCVRHRMCPSRSP
jgi:hypothetical protein